MGRPAFFLRLAGCIAPICPWCDTPEGHRAGRDLPAKEILQQLDGRDRLVVITGGEPFLQWGDELKWFETSLLQKDIGVQYETSGKVPIPQDCQGRIICSPKFLQGRWQFDPVNHLAQISAFKFVIEAEMEPVLSFIANYGIPHQKVWLMAEGATRNRQLHQATELWDLCVKHGFNYSPRLHILTHDTKRSI